MQQCRSIVWSAVFLLAICWPNNIIARQDPVTADSQQPLLNANPIKPRPRPCFEAAGGKSSEQLQQQAFAKLAPYEKAWLTEDVAYIIQSEERCVFLKFESDDEHRQFIEQFWRRRASNPDDMGNDFKEEHYRRIAFANAHFGMESPGWMSDRGHVYIVLGPPDSIDSHSNGESKENPSGNHSETLQQSSQKWHYRYVEGLGQNIDLEFMDANGTGNYRLTMSEEERKFLLPPDFRWIDWKDYQPPRFDLTPPDGLAGLEVPVSIPGPASQVRFKDLEAIVVAQVIREQVYFSHRVEYVRATNASTIARITVDIPVPDSNNSHGRAAWAFEIFGRISTLSGWVVDTFGRSVSMLEQKPDHPEPGWEATVALRPGSYRLAVVVKNASTGEAGVWYAPLDVPAYEELTSHR